MIQDNASKVRLAKLQATHRSGKKGLQALIFTFEV